MPSPLPRHAMHNLAFSIDDAQAELNALNLPGWLLYDFHGQNPTAADVLGLPDDAHLTRRWFYCIPVTGEPTLIAHAIEQEQLPELPGKRVIYRSMRDLERALTTTLDGLFAVAMEYYPRGAIPYLSRVDAGTVEWIRSLGVDVASSHALVTRLLCRWTDAQRDAHAEAAAALVDIKDAAFDAVEAALQAGDTPTEYDIQQQIMAAFDERGLVTDHPPIVASGAHAGRPHYAPSAAEPAPIERDRVLLIDLWARFDRPDGVYADLTYMAWVGPGDVPEPVDNAFRAVRQARDAALRLARERFAEGEPVRGWELDRAARAVLHREGLLEAFTHRTGHNLGAIRVHGDGPHLDDLETHDSRELIPRIAYTIEPGAYLPEQGFGIRSEIDVYLHPEDGPTVYVEAQQDWRRIDPTPPATEAPDDDAEASAEGEA